jgi:PIN domain nuclease of toxin-antitoxin system
LIYLDTHVVVWFYAQDKARFPLALQWLMNREDWLISPIVRLVLQYLHEIGRINQTADTIVAALS